MFKEQKLFFSDTNNRPHIVIEKMLIFNLCEQKLVFLTNMNYKNSFFLIVRQLAICTIEYFA